MEETCLRCEIGVLSAGMIIPVLKELNWILLNEKKVNDIVNHVFSWGSSK